MGTTPARAWVWEEPVGMAVWCLLQLLVVPGEYSRPATWRVLPAPAQL